MNYSNRILPDNLRKSFERDINGLSFLSKDPKGCFYKILKDLSEQIMNKLDSVQRNAKVGVNRPAGDKRGHFPQITGK